jgi:hypothetical protein
MNTHPALRQISSYQKTLKSTTFHKIMRDGYAVIDSCIPDYTCNAICAELESELFNSFPFRTGNLPSMQGITRSPFLRSKLFIDLLLNKKHLDLCREFFPTFFQLHLTRAVSSFSDAPPFSTQKHRDIPYLHTPSQIPISLSFLTLLSDHKEPFLRIWEESHQKYFFNIEDAKPYDIHLSQGYTLVFDSNLVHQSLESINSIHYMLHMYSSPIVKPIVSYTSPLCVQQLLTIDYRASEILEVLGYKYTQAGDDEEYLSRRV